MATPQRLADGEPTDPFREVAPGLLARTRFVTDRTGAPAMEIWDLMVGPGRDASKARLPGAAIVQVRSGAGTLAIGGAAGSELHAGATLTIDEGAEIAVTNGDKVQPLMLRATIVRGAAR